MKCDLLVRSAAQLITAPPGRDPLLGADLGRPEIVEDAAVACVDGRVVARVDGHVAKLAGVRSWAGDPREGAQRAYFSETGAVSLRRYHRARLVPGKGVRGPALIEDEWSTTLIRPGQRCVADRLGNLIIESGA